MRRSILLTIISIAMVAFAGCTQETQPTGPNTAPSPATSPTASPATSPAADDKKTDEKKEDNGKAASLTGRWQGAEGTYLNVEKKGDKFEIEIKDLDGSKKFEGTARGDVIEFTRDGKTETIKIATGEETGMKWLAEKKNCVVITKGKEGYCKD